MQKYYTHRRCRVRLWRTASAPITLTVRASRQTLRRYSSVSTDSARFAAPSLSFCEPHRLKISPGTHLHQCDAESVNATDRNNCPPETQERADDR